MGVRAAQALGLALSSACFWSSSPQPPQPQVPETPWADEGGSVYHLTDEDFDQFVKEHSSVLVMFHAPCEWDLAPCPATTSPSAAQGGHHSGIESQALLSAASSVPGAAPPSRCHCPASPWEQHKSPGQAPCVPNLSLEDQFSSSKST